MNDVDIQDFVSRLAAAWAARDPEAFLALWHTDGILRSPLYDRPVTGNELGRLTELLRQAAPDHVWQLLDWTARGDVVIVEWQATRTVGGQRHHLAGSNRRARGAVVDLSVPARHHDLDIVTTQAGSDPVLAARVEPDGGGRGVEDVGAVGGG